jgi:sec-independent protein translocase protein TatA
MSIGPWQVILVLVIVLIIFGAGKLPRVAADIAKGVKNFKKGMAEDDGAETAEVNKAINDDGKAAESTVNQDKAARG